MTEDNKSEYDMKKDLRERNDGYAICIGFLFFFVFLFTYGSIPLITEHSKGNEGWIGLGALVVSFIIAAFISEFMRKNADQRIEKYDLITLKIEHDVYRNEIATKKSKNRTFLLIVIAVALYYIFKH